MRSTRMALIVVAGMVTLGLGACGGDEDSPAEGSETTATASASAGPVFAAMMVTHHQDGIKMAQLAVDKAETPGVKELAQRSVQAQQAEVPSCRRRLSRGASSRDRPSPRSRSSPPRR